MPDATPRSLERLGLTALWMLTLAPALLQGLWRPLAAAAKVELDAAALTVAALAVAGAAVVALALRGASSRWLPGASAAITALLLGVLVGGASRAGAVAAGALLGVALFCGALGPWLLRSLPEALDGLASRRKGTTALLILLGLGSIWQTSRLSIFMGDASRGDLSFLPDSDFLVHHSCLSAYVQGARLATDGVENLYAMELWPHLSETAEATANGALYAPFSLDAFAYPPPFLLLPRLLLTPLGDFASQRAVWFSLSALFGAAGLWTLARWIGGRAGLRALLLAPLVWTTAATAISLQSGNAHLVVVTMVMLALVAFDTRRPAIGGALLAFAVLSKISPGLLVLVLLLQRRFRDVAWTAAWGLGLSLAGLALFGLDPFVAFVTYELPRLSSGEALAFLTGPETVPINLSPFGLPFKLELLGVDIADPWALARRLNQLFSLGLVVLAGLSLRKGRTRRAQGELWAALLTLASLRSPLAPIYVLLSLYWGLTFVAVEVRGRKAVIGATLLWATLTLGAPPTSDLVILIGLLQQAIMFLVTAYLVVRKTPPDEELSQAAGLVGA